MSAPNVYGANCARAKSIDSDIGARVAKIVFFALLLLLKLCAVAQSCAAGDTRPKYNILRFDENWSSLKDPKLRTDYLDRLKYIPLAGSDLCRFVTLGGEFRETYEDVLNDNFSHLPFPSYSFSMERMQLFADAHLEPGVRLFVQLESGLEQGRRGGPRPIDEKRLDLLNAFVDIKPNQAGPSFRVGRQELNFGSGRLVSVREGPNVRQAFYGVRVSQQVAAWTLDAFASRPAKDNPGFFDNVPLHTTEFWGAYTSRRVGSLPGESVDVYYLGLDRKTATFNSGTARELRHTVGARIVSPARGEGTHKAFIPHYDVEAVYQFGSFGTRSISAWTTSGEAGYILSKVPMTPHIGLRADVSSGDGGQIGRALGTFNPIFPIGNYFGVISDTGPGPVNFRDLHPDVRLTLRHGVSIDADWFAYWRQSLSDGLYNVPGGLLIPASETRARYVGNRPGTEVRWQINEHAYLQADYGIFFAGAFLQAVGHPHNLSYGSVWMGYKF